MANKIALSIWFAIFFIGNACSQAVKNPIPKIIEKNGRHALLVDGVPYFILGGQAHNSSGWPAMLPGVWSAVNQLHANTLEIPVYWEQLEPEPGKFNFSIVDTLLSQARHNHVRLVLLWFATWKNGSNHYMPGWMKRDAARYPNVTGNKGQPVDAPSPHSNAALAADITAFAKLMAYLRQHDSQHTVIMIQAENEPGTWGSVRDFSAAAQQLFKAQVPAALMEPGILKQLNVPVTAHGTWQMVFGDRAGEYFNAWYIARYIGQVVASGKKAYPLPVYVNAALRDPLTNPPASNYESGGATDNVIPIWKAAAPAIDLLAPDIYLNGSERELKIIELYSRPDNTLFVPEAGLTPLNAKYLYAVLGSNGIGFSPFGIDKNSLSDTSGGRNEQLNPYASEYEFLSPMMKDLAQWDLEGMISSAVEKDDHGQQIINLGSWEAVVTFGKRQSGTLHPNKDATGKLIIIRLQNDEFLLAGTDCNVTFRPIQNNKGRAWQYLKVEEGTYENNKFNMLRVLNGDETDWGGPQFGNRPDLLRVTLTVR